MDRLGIRFTLSTRIFYRDVTDFTTDCHGCVFGAWINYSLPLCWSIFGNPVLNDSCSIRLTKQSVFSVLLFRGCSLDSVIHISSTNAGISTIHITKLTIYVLNSLVELHYTFAFFIFLYIEMAQAVTIFPPGRHGPDYPIYREISNISHTKSQNLNYYRLVLRLSPPITLKPGVKSRLKM